MTRDVIPGSRNMPYEDQKKLLSEKGYKLPPVRDAALAVLWENQRSGSRCLGDKPLTYTRCKEIVEGWPLAVGDFAPSGLSVCFHYYVSEDIGVAGWRKF